MFAPRGPIAVLKNPRTPKAFLTFAKGVLAGLTGNPDLSDPTPSLTILEADIAALDDAETKASDRSPVAIADRNAKGLKVHQDLGHVRDYVQRVVETRTSAAEGIALIRSAGLEVRESGRSWKPELAVKRGGVAGDVEVVARAIAGAGVYYWEISVNLETWSALPDSRTANTLVSGLTVGQTYHFRARALTRKGLTDFTQVVSFVVH